MNRLPFGTSVLLGLLLLAPAAAAQQRAHGTLFVRIDEGVARAAVRIAVDPGYHIYHGPETADLGPGDVVGLPTVITLGGEGIELKELHVAMTDSVANPIYLALDPRDERVLGRFDGATLADDGPFVEFLRSARRNAGAKPRPSAPD